MRRALKMTSRIIGAVLLAALAFVLLRVLIVEVNAQTVPAEQLAGPDGQFIDVDGASLYVIDKGDKAAPAVILLHGFGGSTFSWRYTIDPLVEAGYRAVAFDRPPYGLADKDPNIAYTTENYVALTAGLLDALDIETAVLVGHSAGGGVIAQFALAHPERVNALVYVAGAVRVPGFEMPAAQDDSQQRQSVFAPLFNAASQLDPNSPLAQLAVRQVINKDLLAGIARGNYYDQSKATDDAIAGYTQVLDVQGWEGAFLKLFTQRDTLERAVVDLSGLQTLDVPVLIVWGENDAVVPLAVGEALRDYIEGAAFIAYPQTGHLPMEENPDAFHADLLAWLAENQPVEP